jgi:GNAT superfamily N-acetyltransferase
MIRRPGDQDLPQLLQLWREAFGDSEAETLFYFHHRHRHEHMLVMEADGRITGMLSLLPITLMCASREHQARYVFAVATQQEFRGRGVSTALLNAAHEVIHEEGGVASILVPASEGLFTFYNKRGYQTAFFADQARLSAEEIASFPLRGKVSGCGAEDYLRIRKAAFSASRLFVDWDLDALSYIKHAAETGGGRVLRLLDGESEAAGLIEPWDGFMRVTELALTGMTWQTAMALVHREVQAKQYLLRLQQGSLNAQCTIPFGMIHWLKALPQFPGGPPYLALAKD